MMSPHSLDGDGDLRHLNESSSTSSASWGSLADVIPLWTNYRNYCNNFLWSMVQWLGLIGRHKIALQFHNGMAFKIMSSLHEVYLRPLGLFNSEAKEAKECKKSTYAKVSNKVLSQAWSKQINLDAPVTNAHQCKERKCLGKVDPWKQSS